MVKKTKISSNWLEFGEEVNSQKADSISSISKIDYEIVKTLFHYLNPIPNKHLQTLLVSYKKVSDKVFLKELKRLEKVISLEEEEIENASFYIEIGGNLFLLEEIESIEKNEKVSPLFLNKKYVIDIFFVNPLKEFFRLDNFKDQKERDSYFKKIKIELIEQNQKWKKKQ